MPSTSNYGLRYPANTDYVASGATNIKELAQDVVGVLNGFGGTAGQCTSGTTSGTTGLTLADYTFTDPPADMIVLAFGMIRYTQTVATDVFKLYIDETTGVDVTLSEILLPAAGTTSESSGTVFAATTLTKAQNRRIRLYVKRLSGTGTLTVTTASNANRYAILCLPGAFA